MHSFLSLLLSFHINIIFPFSSHQTPTPNQVLHPPRLKLLFQIQWDKLHFGPHFCRRRLWACAAPTLYRLRTGTGTGILLLDDLRWWWCKMVRGWVFLENVYKQQIENSFMCISQDDSRIKMCRKTGGKRKCYQNLTFLDSVSHLWTIENSTHDILSIPTCVCNNIGNPQSSKSQLLLTMSDNGWRGTCLRASPSKKGHKIQTRTYQHINSYVYIIINSLVTDSSREQNVWNANDEQAYLKGHCRKIASLILNNTCLDFTRRTRWWSLSWPKWLKKIKENIF